MNKVYLRYTKIVPSLTIFMFNILLVFGVKGLPLSEYISTKYTVNDPSNFSLISYAIADSGFSLEKITPYDLNKDGFKDLVFLSRRDVPSLARVMLLPGGENGLDVSNIMMIIEDPDIYSLFIGDWDGDLNADLITGLVRHLPENSATNDILKIWFLNNITIVDTIRFQVPEEIYLGSPLNPLSLRKLADFDLDGKSELVLGGFSEITIGWNDGNNVPTFQKVTDKGANTYTVAVFDYNQDGYPDFLNDDQYATEPVIHENQKNRSFIRKTIGLPKVAWNAMGEHYWNFKAIWFNQDYYPDIFTQRANDQSISDNSFYELYVYQDTSSSYAKSEVQIGDNNISGKIIPIHFNNDGYLDFVEVSRECSRIWINNENKSFDIVNYDFGVKSSIQNMFNLDYDSDGDLDIFFTCYLNDTLYQIINNENIINTEPTIPSIDNISAAANEINIKWSESQDDYSLNGHINYKLWLQSENTSFTGEIHNNRINIKNLPAGNYYLSIAASDPIGLSSGYSDVLPFTITTTSISDKELNPSSFQLLQNHPNPFNSITIIKYEIPQKTNTVLKIYDINGQMLKTLVNQIQEAGYYSVPWDATEYSSGVYFYRIQVTDPAKSGADNFQQVKKMLLIK